MNETDKTILLLSADWFYPYWYLVGLEYEPYVAKKIQSAARTCVKDMMSEAAIYWNVAHSAERVDSTEKQFVALVREAGLSNDDVQSLVSNLNKSLGDTNSGETKTTWLFSVIVDLARKGDINVNKGLKPDSSAKFLEFLMRPRAKRKTIDFERIADLSDTQWDRYLKNLTPDTPTFISDFVELRLGVSAEFRAMWTSMASHLNGDQCREVAYWIVEEAKKIAGPNFSFEIPDWMERAR